MVDKIKDPNAPTLDLVRFLRFVDPATKEVIQLALTDTGTVVDGTKVYALGVDTEAVVLPSTSADEELTSTGDNTIKTFAVKSLDVGMVVYADENNVGLIRVSDAPTNAKGYPLSAGMSVGLAVSQASNVKIWFEKSGDKGGYLGS